MENLSEQTDAEKAGNAVKQTVKTNIGQIAEIGENAENAEETAQATERAEFGLDGLVADVNIPRGTVVLAATPIGNTGDASARLIALMEGADIVAAEDTRRLYALANRLGIRVPGRVVAYHDHNERDKADGLLDQVEQGATVLVVSDAGMPTINDPGLAIVRRAIERGLPVTCAPGPSAVLDALCLSGLPTDRFCYEGFLPRKHSERVQHLRALKSERRTIVFYETLHRIDESMADLLDVLGPNRKMALCRELTKDYEQIRRGTIADIRRSVVDDPPRGEMVLVIAGASEEEADAAAPATLSIEDLAVLSVDRAQEDNLRIKDAISQVVAEHPLSDGSLANRKQVYNAVLAMKGRSLPEPFISNDFSNIRSASGTPGPPTCARYSNIAGVAEGLATSHLRNRGAYSAICHSTSCAVSALHATNGVNSIGGAGGSTNARCRACG